MHASRVIVVDDDASVRTALARLLRAEGFLVQSLASAEEFLAQYAASVGCLVLDVRLGGMSGFELQDRLLAAGRVLPIVFISGQAEALRSERLERPGTLALVAKPVAIERLLALVAKAVTRESPR